MPQEDLPRAVTGHAGCVRITCRVQPRASRNAFAGMYDGAVKVALTAPPVEGKANAALCAFFAERLKCPKSAVSVLSGTASKNKILEVRGVSVADVIAKLSS